VSDRKGAALQQRLADKEFDDGDVIALLAEMDIDTLIGTLGEPERMTQHATAPGWKVGEGRPELANEDPAVMQAIGRCAWSRIEGRPKVLNAHPSECGWCQYPVEELLRACSWAVAMSGYVVVDVLVWRGKGGSVYARSGGEHGYQRAADREFWELPVKERERRVQEASGRLLVLA
jgi:hypothetical protein